MTPPPKILRGWSPSTTEAQTEFDALLRAYASQIPHDKGINAWITFRDMIGQIFPGQIPAPMALSIMTLVSANAIASMLEQLEGALEFDTPGAVGRRAAVAAFFESILHAAADQREQVRIAKLFKPDGVA